MADVINPEWEPEHFLERVMRVVPGIVYVFNQKTQSNEYANRSLTSVLGYEAAEAAAMGDAMMPRLCHPDDFPKVLAHFAALQTLKDGEILVVDYRMKHKSGEWVWLVSYDTVFERSPDGSVLRHIGKALDVTEAKAQERAIRAAQTEIEAIFETVSSGIIAFNGAGDVVRFNAEAGRILGPEFRKHPEACLGKVGFLDPETLHPLEPGPMARIQQSEPFAKLVVALARGENQSAVRYLRLSSTKVASLESRIQMVLLLDDITAEIQSRRAFERKSRLDALGQLTGGIAHDFNNVLGSLLYAIDLAEGTENAEKRARYLRIAKEAINRGSSLTTRLLGFAKRQPGIASVRATKGVLEDFRSLIRPMLEEQIALEVVVSQDDLFHDCDQAQLETALMNLILNARDAITKKGTGGGLITIRARPIRAQAGDGPEYRSFVEISVSDTGVGMDEVTLARCVDPFFSTKDSQSGTGLGLASVYGFVSQSDGDFSIYSEPGVGTTIRMALPRGELTEAQAEEQGMVPSPRGQGERVLIVEDEESLADMIAEVVEGLGYAVVTALSGEAALALLEEGEAVDLLLTDVVFSGQIGGFELASRVRQVHPSLPVIYMSGYSGFTESQMGDVPARLLQKPAAPKDLAIALAQALGRD